MVDNNTGNRGYLSDAVNEDGLYPIHGIAIGNNDITVGHKSGEPKLWRPDVLEEAADTLEGKDIVVNHENQDAYLKIGEVDKAKYDEERGVIYRGAIDDDELAEKIGRDWLEVSPRIKHTKAHEEIQGVKVPEAIRDFDNLSVVRRGAAGSNELNLGETEELSVEELQESFESDSSDVSEYQTVAGDEDLEELQEDINYARWMYKDVNGAIGATDKFGCEGTHSHEIDGETWYMPCSNHEQFLRGLKDIQKEEASVVEEMQLSEARTPEYDGTEETSWGDVSKDLTDWVDALEYDDIETVDDLNESQRQEVANHTLLGDSEGETWDEISYFPVVNPNTGSLNRGALEAVRGGRGQSADISESTWESAASVAGRLLEEEFDTEVPDVEELAEHTEEMSYNKEELRVASQLASNSSLTKNECLSIVDMLNPNKGTDVRKVAELVESIMEEDELEDFLSMFGDGEENEDVSDGNNSILNSVLK